MIDSSFRHGCTQSQACLSQELKKVRLSEFHQFPSVSVVTWPLRQERAFVVPHADLYLSLPCFPHSFAPSTSSPLSLLANINMRPRRPPGWKPRPAVLPKKRRKNVTKPEPPELTLGRGIDAIMQDVL